MNINHKKILIIFDAAGCTPLSMYAAAELAAEMQTGLDALYIEDNDLLNAAALPFTREISLHTAERRNIDTTSVLQKYRAEAESIKKQIEEIAVTRRVSISFSSMRGHKTQVVKNWNDETSIVFIPAGYQSDREKYPHHNKDEVVVVYEESNPSSDKALSIAISQATSKSLRLLIIADNEQAKLHVESSAGRKVSEIRLQVADFSNRDNMILLVKRHEPALLVLPDNSLLATDEKILQQLINSLNSDIVIVR